MSFGDVRDEVNPDRELKVLSAMYMTIKCSLRMTLACCPSSLRSSVSLRSQFFSGEYTLKKSKSRSAQYSLQ